MTTPDDRKYAKTHEWIRIEGGMAIVGISDHAQESMGDLTYVEFPRVGQGLKQGKECGVVESVKAASDIYAPLDGTVAEINMALEDDPGIVNRDPYGEGWIYKLKDWDENQLGSLLTATQYAIAIEA